VPGIQTIERELTLEELYQADEVFITSTTRGLLPVREIAGRALSSSIDVCGRLLQAFNSYLSSDIARRKHLPASV